MSVYVTPAQAAAELRVSVATLYGLIRDGRVPARRVGTQWRIPQAGLDAAATQGEQTVPVETAVSTAAVPAAAASVNRPVTPAPLAKPRLKPPELTGWVTEQRR